MIELTQVTQHYGIKPVLKDINLRIETGELAAVIGPNGMGKSTLLGVMAGVLPAQHGTIDVDEHRRRSSVEAERTIRRRLVYLPDTPWLPTVRTGREFLLSVAGLYQIDVERRLEHAEGLLRLFELSDLADSRIASYSAGQRKKIGLASALITETPIMLLDEPFSGGLDPSGIMVLKKILRRRVEEQGATIVMTTPVPELMEELADRVVVLHDGRVIANGSIDEICSRFGHNGSFQEALEHVIFPQTHENLEHYFEVSR
jgi:ABC-type multidrug transport system ATPase subunit